MSDDSVNGMTEIWFWEEAGCLPVQLFNLFLDPDQNWTVNYIDGWELQSINNGHSEARLFDIPATYREGSMKQFVRERMESEYGSDYLEKVSPYVKDYLADPKDPQ